MLCVAYDELERAVAETFRVYSNGHRGSSHKSIATSALLRRGGMR
jgi:hypothetical protein